MCCRGRRIERTRIKQTNDYVRCKEGLSAAFIVMHNKRRHVDCRKPTTVRRLLRENMVFESPANDDECEKERTRDTSSK